MNSENCVAVLTIAEVAELLKVKKTWVYDHINRALPILPHVRAGRTIRFRLQDVRRFMDQQTETRVAWERNLPKAG